MRRLPLLPLSMAWGVADQALSSLTNFGLSFLVARTVGPTGYGAFGVALVTYWTALAVVRALSSQPLVIRLSGRADVDWRNGAAAATGTALTVGAVSGLGCIAVAALSTGIVSEAFLALGISMPGLLVQDTWRFAFFAHGRGRAAFENDLAWTLLQFPALFLLITAGRLSVLSATLAWGLAATAAAIFGLAQSHVVPGPRSLFRWLREQRALWSRFIGEVIVNTGSSALTTYGIVVLAGLTANGTINAGLLLLSPLNMLFQALSLAVLPEAVKALRVSPARLVRLCALCGGFLGIAVLLWGLVVGLIPSTIGVELLHGSWAPAQTVLLPLTLSYSAAGIITGANIGIRALAAANRSLSATVVTSSTSFAGNMVGASRAGAVGAVQGGAVMALPNVVVWWALLARALEDHRRGQGTVSDGSTLATVDDVSGNE